MVFFIVLAPGVSTEPMKEELWEHLYSDTDDLGMYWHRRKRSYRELWNGRKHYRRRGSEQMQRNQKSWYAHEKLE